jgi:hypothetical protein
LSAQLFLSTFFFRSASYILPLLLSAVCHVFDNESLQHIAVSQLNKKHHLTFADTNKIFASAWSCVTSPMRFPGFVCSVGLLLRCFVFFLGSFLLPVVAVALIVFSSLVVRYRQIIGS